MRIAATSLLLTLMLCFSARAQAPADVSRISFKIPLQIVVGNVTDTLYFGVNPGNTIGIDDDVALGEYLETQAPPLPPPPP